MINIKTYKQFNENVDIDSILDRISKSGYDSLSDVDKKKLDNYSNGISDDTDIFADLLNKKYNDTYRYFNFNLTKVVYNGAELKIYGLLSLPSIENVDSNNISGYIDVNLNSMVNDLEFNRSGYIPYDFVEGLEYELDAFIESIVDDVMDYIQD